MAELSHVLEDVFRREKGRVVGGLVRLLGNLDAAEEAFQEAVLAALPAWRANGTPSNPAAWLTTAAKNYARDAARHRRIVDREAPLLIEDDLVAPATLASIADDELRLIFTCCHPVLTLDTQVALTLKVDGATYVRLCTLRATQRKTSQEILSEALREYLDRAESRR